MNDATGREKRALPCRCGIERPLYKWTDDKISRRVTFLRYTADGNRVQLRLQPAPPERWRKTEHARRPAMKRLAFLMERVPDPSKEDLRQTRRDLRVALIFGIVSATIELGVILYFFW